MCACLQDSPHPLHDVVGADVEDDSTGADVDNDSTGANGGAGPT